MTTEGRARLDLSDLRDRLVILHAMCVGLASLAVAAPAPIADRLEVLAVEAQVSSEQALTELAAIVATLLA